MWPVWTRMQDKRSAKEVRPEQSTDTAAAATKTCSTNIWCPKLSNYIRHLKHVFSQFSNRFGLFLHTRIHLNDLKAICANDTGVFAHLKQATQFDNILFFIIFYPSFHFLLVLTRRNKNKLLVWLSLALFFSLCSIPGLRKPMLNHSQSLRVKKKAIKLLDR